MTTTLSPADVAAHVAAQGLVRSARPPKPSRTILERFSASHPRGQFPAEEFARDRRREGIPAEVVMDLATDSYLVFVPGGEQR